jgi:hypothetical protein
MIMNTYAKFFCVYFMALYALSSYGDGLVSWLGVGNRRANAPVFFWSGSDPTNLAPAGTCVQLLGRPVDSDEDYHIIRGFTSGRTIMTIEVPGFYSMKDMVDVYFVEGAPGERVPAEFQLSGWRGAPTWEEAVNDPNAFIGESEVFINLTGRQQTLLSAPLNRRI